MSNLVVKDNALINASYNLSLVEQRVVLLAIIEARESGKGITANDSLTVHADSYINQFHVHRNTAYQALKDACRDLFARQFSYQELSPKGNVKQVLSRWVSQIAYNDNEASIELIFAPSVVPLITRLEQQFTKYDIEQVSHLSSAYAVRLYELLMQWRSKNKTPLLETNEFRKRLGVLESEYKRSDNFKRRVLDLAVDQINQHTDVLVKYQQHKEGRSISGYTFSFKTKVKDGKLINKNKSKVDSFVFNAKQVSYFSTLLVSDQAFASENALIGETQESFKIRIYKELSQPEKVLSFAEHLERLGVNLSNSTS